MKAITIKAMKLCNGCGQSKKSDEFYSDKSKADGLASRCKRCKDKVVAEYFNLHKTRILERSAAYLKKYRNTIDGKETIRAYQKRYREKNADKIAESDKEYRIRNREIIRAKAREVLRSEIGRKKKREYYEKVKMEAPEKLAARKAIKKAIEKGIITRPGECSRCGSMSQRIEAHHPDYSKPLNVRWLCVPCHNNTHVCERKKSK